MARSLLNQVEALAKEVGNWKDKTDFKGMVSQRNCSDQLMSIDKIGRFARFKDRYLMVS